MIAFAAAHNGVCAETFVGIGEHISIAAHFGAVHHRRALRHKAARLIIRFGQSALHQGLHDV